MSSKSTPLSPTAVGLECPVCLLIPRKEIYQCANGHSICNLCMQKVAICPTCRLAISGSKMGKVRNHYAEALLDTMTFGCGWKKQGCDLLVARDQLSEHESLCKYRTMNLCSLFERSKQCQFQFSTWALHNPSKVDELLTHMESAHKHFVAKSLQWNTQTNIYYEFENFVRIPTLPSFLTIVENSQQTPSRNIFVLLHTLEKDDQDQMLFSLAFAALTSENEGLSSSIKIKVSITAQKSPEVAEVWGDESVPDITWTMKPMEAPKLWKFLEMPVANRPSFPFTLPVSHLQKHFVGTDGKMLIKYSFYN